MMIKQILTRVYVNDMDSAIPFYEKLTGEKCASRFLYQQVGLELARIKELLIIAGTDEALLPFRATNATFLVDSIAEYRGFLIQHHAEILKEIQEVPTGWNMTVRHADGLVVEYVEHKKNQEAKPPGSFL